MTTWEGKEGERCPNCIFSKQINSATSLRECRRFPPVYTSYAHEFKFPIVHSYDWCGEGKHGKS